MKTELLKYPIFITINYIALIALYYFLGFELTMIAGIAMILATIYTNDK